MMPWSERKLREANLNGAILADAKLGGATLPQTGPNLDPQVTFKIRRPPRRVQCAISLQLSMRNVFRCHVAAEELHERASV
jgi:hypothetical protein